VVALLNLDAAVVLLTPLYVRTARQVGLDPAMLAFQPVLLAMLASGVLPVSNLTNLIVASRLSLTSTDFLTHLALPSAVASTVGWFAYRRLFPASATARERDDEVGERPLVLGACAIALFLVLLVGGERVGLQAWVAALVTIGFLSLFTRRLPWQRVPLGTVVLAAALAIVAAGAAAAYPHALASAGDGGGRGFATGAIAGNLLNNLPATLVTLPHVAHVTRVWPLLFGLNAGPSIVITGSLAGLLWQASARASGVNVTAGQFSRVGLLVGLPAMAVGLSVLLVAH
jgi:arsenical pump membrane protein